MSADALLDEAFMRLLGKVREQAEAGAETAIRQMNLEFFWGGGGFPISATVDPVTGISTASVDPVMAEIPYPSRIVWAHLWALDATGSPTPVTCTLGLRLTAFDTIGTVAPVALYGTGLAPKLTAQSTADLDLTNWTTNLITGDTLIATVINFTGSASLLALTMQLRSTDVATGVLSLNDNSGADLVDNEGNPIVLRG